MATSMRDPTVLLDFRLLSRLCCDIGFSTKAWDRRLRMSETLSTCCTYEGLCCAESQGKILCCGSQAEGVGMDFLGSDIDMLFILQGTMVVERGPVGPHDTDHTFQMVPTGHPAYVKLQLISPANNCRKQYCPTPRYCDEDNTGRLLLNGDKIKTIFKGCRNTQIKGPAYKDRRDAECEVDYVMGLQCQSWPSASTEWRTRHRPYNWPTPGVIDKICNHGCELVAVGHPASDSRHLEWRLSSSFAEKTLIRSFNIYQIQCYALLKLVLAFLIKPRVPHTLSSYHMKTIMLHMVETTDPAEWTETNLPRCFIQCLEKLRGCLLDGNCPQYFILGHNLFEHRVQGESRARALVEVEDLLSQGWKCVLQCPPFNHGNLHCGHPYPRCLCYIEYWETQRLLQDNKIIYTCVIQPYACSNNSLKRATGNVFETVTTLLSANREPEDHGLAHCPSRAAARIMQLLLKGQIGYRLLAATQGVHANNPALLNPILEVARRFLEEGCDVDIASGRLKLATFLYQTGQRHACVDTVHQFLAKITVNTVTRCCDTERQDKVLRQDYAYKMKYLQLPVIVEHDPWAMLAQIAYNVSFSLLEMSHAPAGIKYIMENKPVVTYHDRYWDNLTFVDPLVLGLYLLVVCYKDLGRLGKSRRCLELMSRVIQSPHLGLVFYPEVASMLLNYCVRYIIAE